VGSWCIRREAERHGSDLRRRTLATFGFIFLVFVVVAVVMVIMVVNVDSMTMMSVPKEWFQRIVVFVVVGGIGAHGMKGPVPPLIVVVL